MSPGSYPAASKVFCRRSLATFEILIRPNENFRERDVLAIGSNHHG